MHEMIYITCTMPQYIMNVQAQLNLVSWYFDMSAVFVEGL